MDQQEDWVYLQPMRRSRRSFKAPKPEKGSKMTNKPVPATENELPCPHGYHWRGCPQCHRAHTVHKITPELPPLDVLPEDVEAGYDQYLDIRNEHAALHCRERQLSVPNARAAELEKKSSRWKTYARGFADTLIAIE